MSAAGKKNRLKMKYPMKLWPFRPATRAGQNAITIQMAAIKIHQRTDMAASSQRSHRTLLCAAGQQHRHQTFAREQPPMRYSPPANFYGCIHQIAAGSLRTRVFGPNNRMGPAPGSSGTAVPHPRLRRACVQPQSRTPRTVGSPLCLRGAYSDPVPGSASPGGDGHAVAPIRRFRAVTPCGSRRSGRSAPAAHRQLRQCRAVRRPRRHGGRTGTAA